MAKKEEDRNMEKKKSWILRPVAWFCTIIMMLGLQLVAELLCLLGDYLMYRLGGLSTIAIVIWTMLFGSIFIGTFFYSATFLSMLLVGLSDKIYPSNHAFRYYFVGIYELVGCVLYILAAVTGRVTGGSMFWYYARFGWLIYASIVMMLRGRADAEERHK